MTLSGQGVWRVPGKGVRWWEEEGKRRMASILSILAVRQITKDNPSATNSDRACIKKHLLLFLRLVIVPGQDMQRSLLSRTLIACTLLACTRTLYQRAFPIVAASSTSFLSILRHQSSLSAQPSHIAITTPTTTMAKTEILPSGEKVADDLPKIAPADFRAYNRMAGRKNAREALDSLIDEELPF